MKNSLNYFLLLLILCSGKRHHVYRCYVLNGRYETLAHLTNKTSPFLSIILPLMNFITT